MVDERLIDCNCIDKFDKADILESIENSIKEDRYLVDRRVRTYIGAEPLYKRLEKVRNRINNTPSCL